MVPFTREGTLLSSDSRNKLKNSGLYPNDRGLRFILRDLSQGVLMFSSIPLFRYYSIPSRARFSALLALLLGVYIASGCSSGMSMNPPPVNATSNVVVAMTSTANDRLVQFHITIASIDLVDKAGNTVTLYTNSNPPGF